MTRGKNSTKKKTLRLTSAGIFDPTGTIIDFAQHSSNLEYELSLKEVANRMYTDTGKRQAREGAAFMDEFYSRLGRELKGII